MSLPLLHAGRTNPGLSAALDLRFALDKSLTAYRGPTPSFSRASTGSYFDGSGVLRYANVNLLTYSENFSDASWTKNSATVTNDSIVSPDGKTTADTLTESSANATHFVNKSSSTSAGTIYTSSIYAKAGTRKYIDVTSVAQDGGIFRRFNNVFDLETGTWQSTASLNSPANTAYSITSVGNGWYRISSSILAYGSTHYLVVYLSNSANPTRDASNDVVYTGNGTGNLYIWGAQLEASSTVGTYCPTTSSANSAPRFDHTFNGTSWVSKGLLVEEQRTNLALWSEDLSNGYWTKTNCSITADAIVSPDGNSNADLAEFSASGTAPRVFQTQSFSVTSGTSYTKSFFVKAGTQRWIQIVWSGGAHSARFANFDTLTMTFGTVSANVTTSVANVGNGWYRVSATSAATATALDFFWIYAVDSGTSGWASNSTSGGSVYVFGFQHEAGSFPTSYIPTTTASTTRSADVCQITGGDFSGFWNATEGSVAVEFDQLADATKMTNESYIYGFQNAADTEQFILRGQSSGIYYWRSVNNGNIEATAQISSLGTSPVKHAACYKLNDFASTFNGAAVVSDTSGATPNPTALGIGFYFPTSSNRLNGHIARLRYYRKRLPNETLQLLSEPDPTLNLQFALNKSLTPVAGPAPSFSRASTGSYFDSTGTLKYANVNLITYSEQFDNAAWSERVGSTISTNVVASPIGDLTADQLQLTSSGLYYQKKAYTTTGTHTFSVWLRSSSPTTTLLRLSNDAGTENSVVTCNVTTSWQRFSVTRNWSANPINFYAGLDQRTVVGGPGTSTDVFIWGAQLELASSPSQYAKTEASTTAGPRFDHVFSGGQWISRGLLVEEQRTNLATNSELFSNASWTKYESSVTANAQTSPDGTNSGFKFIPNTNGTSHYLYMNPTMSANTSYTCSVFAKKAEYKYLQIGLIYNSTSDCGAQFDLDAGIVTRQAGQSAGYTAANATITNVGNGWYRCSVTLSAGRSDMALNITGSNTLWTSGPSYLSFTGDGTSGIYLWGAQMEAGSFATSYTGTTSSPVVRSADVCQITGTSFNWMWNQGEGSVAFEADTFSGSSDLCRYFEFTMLSSVGSPSIGSATVNSAGSAGGDNVYNFVWDSGFQAQLFASPARPSAKNAFAWKANDFAASINGAAALTDTSGTVPSGIDVLTIASRYGSLNLLNGHIAKLIYYPARLTNTKLQQLST